MGLPLGIGPSRTAMQRASVVASRWFTGRQGLVLGIMMGATATGMLIFMPLAVMISEAYGWRLAMAIPTVGCILSLALFYFFADDWPEDINMPHFAATARLLAVIGVSDLMGTMGSGWLSDQYVNRWLLFFYYGLRGIGLMWLVSSEPPYVMLTIFAVVYGLGFIATVLPTFKLTVNEFGREMGSAVFGWIFAAHHVAAGLMAYGAAVSRDMLGSYVPSFMLAGIACLVAAASFYLLKRPKPHTI